MEPRDKHTQRGREIQKPPTKSRAITVTEEMAPAQSSDMSMEGLRGACVSPPEVSSTEAEPVPTNLEDSECCCWTQWWRCLKNRLPVDFWHEEVQLLKLAGPVVRLENIAAPCLWKLRNVVSPLKYFNFGFYNIFMETSLMYFVCLCT